MSPKLLKLKSIDFASLFDAKGLQRLDEHFLNTLPVDLKERLAAYRQGACYDADLILACAVLLEQFLARLFSVESETKALICSVRTQEPIFAFKKWYVLREARRRLKEANTYPSFRALDQLMPQGEDKEFQIASLGEAYLKEPEKYAKEIEQLIQWCVKALCDPEGQTVVKDWVSFKIPRHLDYDNLVPTDPLTLKQREGFDLTDPRMSERSILNEVHYCIYCHDKQGDFCSKGFPVKKSAPEKDLKKNLLGEVLTGCPLEEKISEMMSLKKRGHVIAPLAVVMIDNPLCPATGHRICNDCMKSCIYQKQEPVNIPEVETRVLTDVLNLPWGVEIYDLLTRWNPLRQTQYQMKPYNGLKVLVVGMGPAGISLAHHLTMEGCAVVGVDGLKIEPLNPDWINKPVYSFETLKASFDERIVTGFGGVAEYGITARWDKNFLTLIYLTLMRRKYFQVFGGVRLGGTLKVEDAWTLGFNHVSIAVGAGLPKALDIPNSMVPGMRQANDVLMTLQLTGAAKKNSLSALQLRLPAVVIGGGLTAVDTATEVQAYYIRQVEKLAFRYENLKKELGFTKQERLILEEFLTHAKAIRLEREKARRAGREPDFISLIKSWGGVTIVYRRKMQDSPAYKHNHEELKKALEEGVQYLENLQPTSVLVDEFGSAEYLICGSQTLRARSILVATGSKPNIAYEFEHRGTFRRSGQDYATYKMKAGELVETSMKTHVKDGEIGMLTSYHQDGKTVSFLGDAHPQFHGSVVKAIASGQMVYPQILHTLKKERANEPYPYSAFRKQLNRLFNATVLDIQRHAREAIELKIQAPQACRHYSPGHFYRLQLFESTINRPSDAVVAVAMRADKDKGILTLLVSDKKVREQIEPYLEVGCQVALMGPTGVRTKIPKDNETVLIMGQASSIARVCAIGAAMREAGNRVIYVGFFNNKSELHCREHIEAGADQIVWVSQSDLIEARRPQDGTFISHDLMSLLEKEAKTFKLDQVDRILIHADVNCLREFAKAKKDYFKKPIIIASVYGPMQCMLKGICAQCLQWQIDPETGERTKAVFACSWQDQPLEMIDINHLEQRLSQGTLLEKLNAAWLERDA